MSQTRPEQDGVQLALREIAEARAHLRLASDALSAFGASEADVEELTAAAHEGRQLEIGAPQDLLDIAHEVVLQVLPGSTGAAGA